MNRVLQPLGIVATVALVGYAGVLLLANPEADEVVEGTIADAQVGEGEDDREQLDRSRERLRRTARGLAMSPEGPDGEREREDREAELASGEPAPAVPYGSGEVDDRNARDGFAYAMRRVDEIGESRRRLSQDEWDALYRETNDAFAALSTVIDSRDDLQVAELEAAHKRLKQGLRKVRVSGQKLAD
jgi:hypothetical protein